MDKLEEIMWNEDLHERLNKNSKKGELLDLLIKVFRSFGQSEVALVRTEIDEYFTKLIRIDLKNK
jgi:hypothetical protein